MNVGRMKSRERGVAAIEFALVFVLLFSVLYALATFGAVFYTQQAVTRAAEEGARAGFDGSATQPAIAANRVNAAAWNARRRIARGMEVITPDSSIRRMARPANRIEPDFQSNQLAKARTGTTSSTAAVGA